MDKSITDHYIFYKYIVASLVIVVIVSGNFFFNYISIIRYNMWLLQRILRDFKQIAAAGANTAAGSKFPPK